MRETGFKPWFGKIPWRREWQSTAAFLPGESPWTEEPGRLQCMGSQRVGHDWATQHSTHSIGPVGGREEEASWRPILTKPAPGMETGLQTWQRQPCMVIFLRSASLLELTLDNRGSGKPGQWSPQWQLHRCGGLSLGTVNQCFVGRLNSSTIT